MPLTTSSVDALARLEHGHEHTAQAIVPDDVGLRREAIAHMGDVAEINRRVAYLTLTGKVVQFLCTVLGAPLRVTSYSNSPILAVPEGNTRFCRFTAFTTSVADRPFDWSNAGFKSIITLGLFSAVRIRYRRAGYCDELGSQKFKPRSFKLLLGKAFS